jgi:serine protease inhibitor
MGLERGFDPKHADFSGISSQPMHIGDILETNKIEVRPFFPNSYKFQFFR